jgi:CheY-like chemotaxis protein
VRSDLPLSVRVLIADDDPHNRRLLGEVCRGEGYEVDEVADGRSALEKVRDVPYNLLLVDASMPERSGFEVVEALLLDPSTNDIPIIMVTANPQDEARARAERLGVFAYVEKPFRIFDLTQRIRLALRRPRRDDEPPTLPSFRLRRTMGDVLTHLPPPQMLRPYLKRALEDAAAAGAAVACVVVRLENGPGLLAHLGRSARDAALGALTVKAAASASGPVHRSDEVELCWLAPASITGDVGAMLASLAQAATSIFDPEPTPAVELGAGVLEIPSSAHAAADDVLRATRALATAARRSGVPFSVDTFRVGEAPVAPAPPPPADAPPAAALIDVLPDGTASKPNDPRPT